MMDSKFSDVSSSEKTIILSGVDELTIFLSRIGYSFEYSQGKYCFRSLENTCYAYSDNEVKSLITSIAKKHSISVIWSNELHHISLRNKNDDETVAQDALTFDLLNLPPASLFRRILASILDYGLLIFALLSVEKTSGSTMFPLFIGLSYLLLKDGLFHGASLGKVIFRLVVVDVRSGGPCGIILSCRRNILFPIVISLVLIITWFLSLIINPQITAKMGAAGIMVAILSPIAGFRSPDRRTYSDLFAGSYVLDKETYHNSKFILAKPTKACRPMAVGHG